MGIMLDSIRYRLYAVESETSEPSGTMSRIRLEDHAGNITYGLELREPFDPDIVADEARSFDPGKPMAMPPVWLLVRGDATPERGLRCLTLAVTVLDAGTWPPDEYDRWLDEHWDDPAEVKAIQYRANAIVDPAHLPDRWIQACVWTITPHDVADIRPACGKPDTMVSHG